MKDEETWVSRQVAKNPLPTKDSKSFEPIAPEEVGGQRRIVIGKHSGRAALAHVLGQQGVDYDEKRLNELLDHVRTLSITKSGEVLAEELVTLYRDLPEQGHSLPN